MTFTKDSPLVSRVVPTASSEQGARPGGAGDIRAITIHMAEGGGTVSWLTRPDGNSSHYVVEYSGAIVQMVQETHWAGSINPNLIRKDNDAAYTYLGESIVYGRAAQLKALGTTGAADPNRYVIAIETEGFASAGPNADQRNSLARLVNDIRRRRGTMATLGHRDWQSYKACPGHKLPWIDYGGHAVKAAYVPPATPTTPPEVPDDMNAFTVPEERTLAAINNGAWLYDNSALQPSSSNVQVSPGRELVYVGQYSTSPDVRIVAYETSTGDTNTTSKAMYVPASGIAGYRVPTPAPLDCSAAVAAATAALTTELANQKALVANYADRLHKINGLSAV